VTLEEFGQALTEAIRLHFADSMLFVTKKRGISLTCRVELSTGALVSVYYHALTGKTSYALIFDGQRVAGYDNYRFWHHHSAEAPSQHILLKVGIHNPRYIQSRPRVRIVGLALA